MHRHRVVPKLVQISRLHKSLAAQLEGIVKHGRRLGGLGMRYFLGQGCLHLRLRQRWKLVPSVRNNVRRVVILKFGLLSRHRVLESVLDCQDLTVGILPHTPIYITSIERVSHALGHLLLSHVQYVQHTSGCSHTTCLRGWLRRRHCYLWNRCGIPHIRCHSGRHSVLCAHDLGTDSAEV